MSALPTLKVYLNDRLVGMLTQMAGDRNLFVFDQSYIDDAERPILSLSYKAESGGLINQLKPTQTKLPPFFSNLLPEGHMREYLAQSMGIKKEREFYLLWKLGQDLPGAIRIEGEETLRLPSSAVESTPLQDETQTALYFSLAGIQMKFSAVQQAHGGLTIPAHGVGGDWIIKLPDARFENVPENEYAMMTLAKLVGIEVPEIGLVSIRDITHLPKGVDGLGENAFVIKRFDRAEHGGRVHIEDFAQIFNVYPDKKYGRASFRNIASVIWRELGIEGIQDFIRRLIFNVLIGNGDMHLKNWSLIYPDGINPRLAPAYDYVSTIPYLPHDQMALNFVDSKAFSSVNTEQLKRFARKVDVPENIVLAEAESTVSQFHDAWRYAKEFISDPLIHSAIKKHLKTLAL